MFDPTGVTAAIWSDAHAKAHFLIESMVGLGEDDADLDADDWLRIDTGIAAGIVASVQILTERGLMMEGA